MHLVFLNQYYPPDAAPTGLMLEAVVDECVRRGHQVTILCSTGGYRGTTERDYQPPPDLSSREESVNDAQANRIQKPDISVSEPKILRIKATRFGRASFISKLLDYTSYYTGVACKLLTMRARPDRIVALTTPPYLSILARATSKFRACDHAHWVMDLYPDVMVAHGMIHQNSLLHKMLTALTKWGFGGNRCAAVVTLGPDMADRVSTIIDILGKKSPTRDSSSLSNFHIQWIPLWGEDASLQSKYEIQNNARVVPKSNIEGTSETQSILREQRGWTDDELVVMYSGNMGLGHRFAEIFEAIKLNAHTHSTISGGILSRGSCKSHFDPIDPTETHPAKFRFVFYGDGKRRSEIQDFIEKHPLSPVELHDYVSGANLKDHLASADVHLISLDPAWTGTMVPSKLQGVFSVARPVILIGDRESSLGKWMVESGGGWIVRPNDVTGLLIALKEACEPKRRAAYGQAAKSFAMLHFDKTTNVARVTDAFVD